jgi:hypothetical protein
MFEQILCIDFKNNEITVENNLSESKKLTMTNVSLGLPSEVYESKSNSSITALIFLSCNIGNIAYFGISIRENSDVKMYLIKVSDFNNEFKSK